MKREIEREREEKGGGQWEVKREGGGERGRAVGSEEREGGGEKGGRQW